MYRFLYSDCDHFAVLLSTLFPVCQLQIKERTDIGLTIRTDWSRIARLVPPMLLQQLKLVLGQLPSRLVWLA